MIPFINRKLLLALQRLMGSRVGHYYREFLAVERGSRDALLALQGARLESVLRAAALNSPFYRAHVGGSNSPALSDFPILRKEDLREHFAALMTESLRREYLSSRMRAGYSWSEVKTGGSTGAPTTVIHDVEFRDQGRASRMYSQYLCGFPFGTPYFRLWGSMADIQRTRDSISHRVMSRLARETVLNAFRMNDADIERYLDIINETPVHHMMAYVDAAQAIARYSQRRNRAVRPLRSIMACAGTVTDDARNILRETFEARIHNKYGSRDCADMACECPEGGLHIYSQQVVLEVVDNVGNLVPPGDTGRLLVTLLGNRSFPLIRYDIGDRGALSVETCRCGRPFPLLARVEGRQVEFLRNSSGGYVTPAYVIHLIGVVHNHGVIRRFQLVQESVARCRILIEEEEGANPEMLRKSLSDIERDLKLVFGGECRFDIERVDRILETASGKFLYTINRMSPQG